MKKRKVKKKANKIYLLVPLFAIFTQSLISAQTDINFEFDFAQFAYDSASNYLEIYYSFDGNNLTARKKESSEFISGKLIIQIISKITSDTVVNKRYIFTRELTDSLEAANKNTLTGVIGYRIPKGKYFLKAGGVDLHDTSRTKYFTESFTALPYLGKEARISDIQIASKIKNDNVNKKSIFYKNTLEVYPNPAMIYSDTSPILYYYSEIYNLFSDTTQGELYLNKILTNSRGAMLYNRRKKLNRKLNSVVEVGLVNLIKYPTGAYTFTLELTDSAKSAKHFSYKKFFLYNPGVVDSSFNSFVGSGYMASEFGILTEEECDNEFALAMYVSTSKEIDNYENLDSLNAKRKFLYNFWLKRDPDRSTPVNEFRVEYLNRYEYVNSKYSTIQRKGWRTDRGRVYLVYGEPDQIDYYPNETNESPHEIWYYNSVEGGVVFVFADLTSFGDYELIHSTKRGELRDDNWRRRILKN